jgi:hypothetical protein
MVADARTPQQWSALERRLRTPLSVDFDTEPQVALVTVNFSTTRWLKLMLLALCEQQNFALLSRIIVVDNGSKDGCQDFLRQSQAALRPARSGWSARFGDAEPVQRYVYARSDIAPLKHDGAPTLRMQQSIAEAGLEVVDIPSNRGGLILHRGRSGVVASAALHPRHQ